MTPEEKRKKKFAAEYKVKVVDEAKKVKKDETTREYVGKTKTGVDVNPTLKTSAEKSVKEARIDEISSRTTGRYVSKATDDYLDASKKRDEPRRAKRLAGILRAHRLEKKRENVDEAVKTTNAGYGYHGTLDGKGADSGYAKAHAKIKEIVNGKPKTGKDKKGEEKAGVPDRVITHYLDSVHGRKLGDSGMLDDAEHVKNDFKKFRQNYDPGHFGEDVEPISELSNATMHSYVKKAAASNASAAADDEKTITKRNRGVKWALASAKKRFPEKFKEEAEMEYTVEEFLEYLGELTEEQAFEEIEQLDELSRKTLERYVDKATVDSYRSGKLSANAADSAAKARRNRDRNGASKYLNVALKYDRKTNKRDDGIARAKNKIHAKEEVEPISELSSLKLKKYVSAAKKNKTAHDMAADDSMDRGLNARTDADIKKYSDLEDKHVKKSGDRAKGIRLASKKIARKTDDDDNDAWHEKQQSRKLRGGVHYHEEVEPISELSGTTLSNYRDKADRSVESGKAGNKISKRISGGLLASKKLYGDPRNVKIGAGAERRSVKPFGESSDVKYGDGGVLDVPVASRIDGSATYYKLSRGWGGRSTRHMVKTKGGQQIQAKTEKSALKKLDAVKEDFVDQLTAVVESRGMSVTFADGTKAAISPGTARRLLDRYETIGEDRQAEFIESISSNLKTLRESVLR